MSQQSPIVNVPIIVALMLNTQALSLTDEELRRGSANRRSLE